VCGSCPPSAVTYRLPATSALIRGEPRPSVSGRSRRSSCRRDRTLPRHIVGCRAASSCAFRLTMFMICSTVCLAGPKRHFTQGGCAKQQHRRRRHRPEHGVRSFEFGDIDLTKPTVDRQGARGEPHHRAAVCRRRQQRKFSSYDRRIRIRHSAGRSALRQNGCAEQVHEQKLNALPRIAV